MAELKVIVERLSIMALVLAASVAHAAEAWRFLPCFHNDVRGIEKADGGVGHFHDSLPEEARKQLESGVLKDDERRAFHWHAVVFPHRDFMRLMPEERVFGWYGCVCDVPNSLAGMEVLVDLGIIDDSDETFVNGARIAATGRASSFGECRSASLSIKSKTLRKCLGRFFLTPWIYIRKKENSLFSCVQ